jgi:hypothetical protein
MLLTTCEMRTGSVLTTASAIASSVGPKTTCMSMFFACASAANTLTAFCTTSRTLTGTSWRVIVEARLRDELHVADDALLHQAALVDAFYRRDIVVDLLDEMGRTVLCLRLEVLSQRDEVVLDQRRALQIALTRRAKLVADTPREQLLLLPDLVEREASGRLDAVLGHAAFEPGRLPGLIRGWDCDRCERFDTDALLDTSRCEWLEADAILDDSSVWLYWSDPRAASTTSAAACRVCANGAVPAMGWMSSRSGPPSGKRML